MITVATNAGPRGKCMNDEQLLRYSRQILLPRIDVEGQERLLNARVLVIGAGGLGSPVALYLAGAGVGHIAIADADIVDISNLQRQVLHRQQDVGENKARSAARAMVAINPDVEVSAIPERLSGEALGRLVRSVDVVVDCSDNFATRYAVNEASLEHGKPLVSAAAIRMEGQLAVFDPRQAQAPCYACLYPPTKERIDQGGERCADSGVLGPVVGMMGSWQALEVIKLIADRDYTAGGTLWLWDAQYLEMRRLNLKRDPSCSLHG